MNQRVLSSNNSDITARLFGTFDMNVRMIEKAFDVSIRNRSASDSGDDCDKIVVDGDNADSLNMAYDALSYLVKLAEYGGNIEEQTVRYVIDMISDGKKDDLTTLGDDCICITTKGRPIKAKTVGQKQYIEAIRNNTVIFGVGPAGTGKTFLAVAMAVKALREKKVSKIILTRPAIEAGEKLGFLPGDLQSKVDPYLRPLYDALYEMMGVENYQRNVEKQIIEIAPLAYMRGRTLDDAFIILDEAQNATPEQMKMFLTRLGFNSKMIVTGDLTQTDLPSGQKSGLFAAVKILDGIEDIAVHRFTDRDVVRHKLVQKIILAYDKYEKSRENINIQSSEKKTQGKYKYRYSGHIPDKNGSEKQSNN